MHVSVCIWMRIKNAYLWMWGLPRWLWWLILWPLWAKATVWQMDMLEAPWSKILGFEYAFWCQHAAPDMARIKPRLFMHISVAFNAPGISKGINKQFNISGLSLRWLISFFLTHRDLRVSKVSLAPTERKELGYVRSTYYYSSLSFKSWINTGLALETGSCPSSRFINQEEVASL